MRMKGSPSSCHKGSSAIPSTNSKEERKQSKGEFSGSGSHVGTRSKLARVSDAQGGVSQFERITDDVLTLIFSALAASATSTADLLNAMLISKRFHPIGLQQQVLKSASQAALSVKADTWSRGADTFLRRCVAAGNAEASFILGTIYYYCLENRHAGHALIWRAAQQFHSAAMHALSIIAFNASVEVFSRRNKNVPTGIARCQVASNLEHVNATRELGHCFESGYGVKKNHEEGRRLLNKASAKARAEAEFLSSNFILNSEVHNLSFEGSAIKLYCQHMESNGRHIRRRAENLPSPKLYPCNQFLLDWFKSRPLPRPLRLCSNEDCGRPESWRKEFPRCPDCRTVQYCSRACAGVDWYFWHRHECEEPEWGGRPDQYPIDEDFGDEHKGSEGEKAEYRLVIPD